jgi:transposase
MANDQIIHNFNVGKVGESSPMGSYKSWDAVHNLMSKVLDFRLKATKGQKDFFQKNSLDLNQIWYDWKELAPENNLEECYKLLLDFCKLWNKMKENGIN